MCLFFLQSIDSSKTLSGNINKTGNYLSILAKMSVSMGDGVRTED